MFLSRRSFSILLVWLLPALLASLLLKGQGEESPLTGPLKPSEKDRRSKALLLEKGELSSRPPLRNFGVEEGLLHTSVRAAMVDRKGYLWVGTDGGGVFRYDGKSFERIDEADGLAGERVLDIFQDRKGHVWIGTIRGLNCYKKGRIESYVRPGNCDTALPGPCYERLTAGVIYDIAQDREGRMWFASAGGGVMRYKDGDFTYFIQKGDRVAGIDSGYVERLPSEVARTVIEGPEGRIWMGTFKGGMVAYDGKKFRYYGNKKGCRAHRKTYEGRTRLPIGSNVFWSSMKDRKERLWIGTPQGLLRKKKNSDWVFFSSDCEGYGSICRQVNMTNVLVLGMEELQDGGYWFGSYDGAFFMKGGRVLDTLTKGNGLSGSQVPAIAESSRGSVWFGNTGGLDQLLSPAIELIDKERGLTRNTVQTMSKNEQGQIWFGYSGGGGGLDRWNLGDSLLRVVDPKALEQAGVMDIEKGPKGALWLATDGGGVLRYLPQEERAYRYRNHFPSHIVYDLHFASDGALWMGGEEMLARVGPDSVQRFTMEDGLSHPHVNTLLEDERGRLWAGTPLRGVNIRTDSGFIQLKPRNSNLRSGQIRDMVLGPKGKLWVATYGGGIYMLPAPNEVEAPSDADWRTVSRKDGLPSDAVNGLYFDEKGRLWAGTDLGAVRIDPGTQEVKKILGRPEGFLGLQCTGAICSDDQGRILFGTPDHLIRYDPERAMSYEDPPKVHLEGLSVGFGKTSWNKKDSLNELGISYGLPSQKVLPNKLSLPHDRSRLVFRFKAVDLRAPDGIRYRYRLKGSNQHWSPWQSRTKAVFNDLPPGSYVFELQAKGRYGLSEEKEHFAFQVRPPWWQTTWFRASSLGGVALLLLLFFRWRTAAIRKRKFELEKKVEERTRELATKNREITDSIDYASSIQQALLPYKEDLREALGEHTVLYLPRDPVSGDFYWCYAPNEREVIWMVADCTGHGVPGAFMSMMGNSLLDEVVVKEGERDPGTVLDRLREGVIQKIGEERRKDGMDAALCYWDKVNGVLHFAGANNPLYLVRKRVWKDPPVLEDLKGEGGNTNPQEKIKPFKDTSDGIEIKGDRLSVGLDEKEREGPGAFSTLKLVLKDGDQVYTFTDGLPDQFGGPKDKKFGYGRFQRTLIANMERSPAEQQEGLRRALEEWRGEREQIDDICVMGVHFKRASPAARGG